MIIKYFRSKQKKKYIQNANNDISLEMSKMCTLNGKKFNNQNFYYFIQYKE